jgi:hypothetical protein
VVLALVVTAAAAGQQVGTDLTGLNLCLYGDCEARGTYAADPYGWANPATMPVGVLPYMQRGALLGGAYFRLNAGGVGANIISGTGAAVWSPVVIAVTGVTASGDGTADSLPGVDLTLKLASVRLLAGVDLERAFGWTGVSAGLTADVPGTSSDVTFAAPGFPPITSHEDHELNLTGGLHWRGGTRQWFMAGALVNGLANPSETEVAGLQRSGTTNAWFARAGVSLQPLVPLGLAEPVDDALVARWLGTLRLATDVEYRNISVPDEGTRSETVAYFGGDVPLLPDAWNPISGWLRAWVVGGIDTQGGWGLGLSFYGNGPLLAVVLVAAARAGARRPRRHLERDLRHAAAVVTPCGSFRPIGAAAAGASRPTPARAVVARHADGGAGPTPDSAGCGRCRGSCGAAGTAPGGPGSRCGRR